MGFSRLSDENLDVLRMIGERVMEQAAMALSRLLDARVCLNLLRVHAMDIALIPKAVDGPERPVVGIRLQILGDARGSILIVLPREHAAAMLEKLLDAEKSGKEGLTELEVSALREVGNILSSAYLSALGDMLGLTLVPSTPTLILDRFGAVVEHQLIESAKVEDIALIVEMELAGEDGMACGYVFLLPQSSFLGLVLHAVT